MKKYLVTLAMIGFTVTFISSCGENRMKGSEITENDSEITVKGSDGTEYESYQECCAANDYEAAHKFLAKMENKGASGLSAAKDYVFKNEALFLMSIGDENTKKRIVYLLKEEGDNNDHVSMLIDLAIENDDESFVKTLGNQYTIGVESENLKKLSEYLSSKQSEENKEFLMALFKKLGTEDLLLDQAIKNNDKAFIAEYASNHLTLSNTSLLNYLAATKDNQFSEKILGLLTNEEKKLPNRPPLGIVKSDHYGELDKSYEYYNSSVKDYNDVCRSILDVAITSKNQYLAQRVISKVKQTLVNQDLGDWCHVVEKNNHNSVYEAFKISLDNSECNAIKASYQEAVRSGAFR